MKDIVAVLAVTLLASILEAQLLPNQGCRPTADVIFLLDGSDSISVDEFDQQKHFIRRFVEMSDVGASTIRIGMAVVSTSVGDVLPLSANMSKEHVLLAVNSLSQPQEGSRMDVGLVEMEQLFATQGRRGVLKIGVVLTDGRAKFERATEVEAQLVKDSGIFLIAIGVGRLIKSLELAKIASTDSNAYNLQPMDLSTKLLHETVSFLGQESCAGRMLLSQLNMELSPKSTSILDNSISTALVNTLKSAFRKSIASNAKQPDSIPVGQFQKPTIDNQQTSIQTPDLTQAAAPTITFEETTTPINMVQDNANVNNVAPHMFMNTNDAPTTVLPTARLQDTNYNAKGLLDQSVSSNMAQQITNPNFQDVVQSTHAAQDTPTLGFPGNIQLSQPFMQVQPLQEVVPLAEPPVVDSLPDQNIAASIQQNDFQQNIGQLLANQLAQGNAAELYQQSVASFNKPPELQSQFIQQLAALSQQSAADVLNQQPSSQNAITKAETAIANLRSVLQTQLLPTVINSFRGLNANTDQQDQPIFGTPAAQQIVPVDSLTSIQMQQFNNAFNSRHLDLSNFNAAMSEQPFAVPTQTPTAFLRAEQTSPTTKAPTTNYTQISTLETTTARRIPVPSNVHMLQSQSDTFNPKVNVQQILIPELGMGEKSKSEQKMPTKKVPSVDFLKGKRLVDPMQGQVSMTKFETGINSNSRFQAPVPIGQVVVTTEAPKLPELSQPPEDKGLKNMSEETVQCLNAHFVDGVAYTLVEDSCAEFLQCFNDGTEITSRRVSCPFETFYDDYNKVCRHSKQYRCWRDPCFSYGVVSYQHNGNCRAYWSCAHTASVPKCCPPSTSFMPGVGCVRNLTCEDSCMDFGNINKVTAASDCKNLAMPEDTSFYFEKVAGMGWMVRRCDKGSMFDQALCRCKPLSDLVNENCKPELYLDFQGSVEDKSGNSIYMGNVNVALYGDTGAFNGRSILQLWRFSGMSLGQHVTILFRFRVSVTAKQGRLMHIVSNCCTRCESEPKPSLDIGIIPGENGGIGVFSIRTREAGEIFLFVPYQDTVTGWNHLEFRYDGLKLKGTVNKQSAEKQVIGSIIGKPETLLIGACGLNGAFDGFLDEFKFYMCNP